MIKGISHITFTVRDLEKTSEMFRTVFGAEEIYSSGDDAHSVSREKFLLAGGLWIALMEGGPAGKKPTTTWPSAYRNPNSMRAWKKSSDSGLK